MTAEQLAEVYWKLHNSAIANGLVYTAQRHARIARAYEREARK